MQSLLPTIPIFTGLKPEALDVLLQEVVSKTVSPGTLIVREGDDGSEMFVIESGEVRVVKCFGTEHETELAKLSEGDFFGEGCILGNLPRIASVQAIGEARLYLLKSRAFYRLYHQIPEQYGIVLLNIARDLSRRLRRLDEIFAACH